MPTHLLAHTPLRWLVFVLLAAVTETTAQAQPRFYETTLILQQPVVNVSNVDRVIYRWSTTLTEGGVDEFAVDDLILELRTPTGPIYVDRMIVDGVAQPFAGLPRLIGGGADIYWRFDLDTSTLEEMANVSEPLIQSSTGLHFDVHDSITIPDDGRVSVKAYLDGVNQDPHTDQLGTQVTVPMLFYDNFESGGLSGWAAVSP
ncbi:MAG: hypothetical protein MI919_36365 [Holophagales bacterium]|nr:hypothetical protein [Holophagales bacterium]